jgi:hypothetical protein
MYSPVVVAAGAAAASEGVLVDVVMVTGAVGLVSVAVSALAAVVHLLLLSRNDDDVDVDR